MDKHTCSLRQPKMAAVPSTKKDRSPIPNLAALGAFCFVRFTEAFSGPPGPAKANGTSIYIVLQATNTNDNHDHYHSLRRVIYSLGDEMYKWRFVLFCFARVELAARDVAIRHGLASIVIMSFKYFNRE